MTDIESLKRDMIAMNEFEDLTSMLEQTAARTIAQMRKDILDSRSYFKEVWRIYGILKKLTPLSPSVAHKHLVVGIGLDWGMAGSLLNRVMDKVMKEQALHQADLLIAGKKSHSRFRQFDDCTVYFFSAPKNATLANTQKLYKIIAGYANVTIIYPSFESLSKQVIAVSSLTIGDRKGVEKMNEDSENSLSMMHPERFIIDPDPQTLVNYLDEAIVGLTMHHYFSESILAYSAAQMVTMRNGHDNAKRESQYLSIRYNRARRENIDGKLRELYGTVRKSDVHNKEGLENVSNTVKD